MGAWVSPTMTTDSAPSPYVTSASDAAISPAWNAMDGSGATYWFGFVAASNWWKLYVGVAGVCINALTIKNSQNNGFHDFKIQGSNDDTNWDDIYTGHADDNENVQPYTFSLSSVYKYFRLLAITVYGGSYVLIREITMAGYTSRPPANYLHARRDRMNMKGVSTQDSLA